MSAFRKVPDQRCCHHHLQQEHRCLLLHHRCRYFLQQVSCLPILHFCGLFSTVDLCQLHHCCSSHWQLYHLLQHCLPNSARSRYLLRFHQPRGPMCSSARRIRSSSYPRHRLCLLGLPSIPLDGPGCSNPDPICQRHLVHPIFPRLERLHLRQLLHWSLHLDELQRPRVRLLLRQHRSLHCLQHFRRA